MSFRLPGLSGAALVGACLTLGLSAPASSAGLSGPQGQAAAAHARMVSERPPITRAALQWQWAWGNPRPSGDHIGAVAAGNGVYVAAGTDGTLYSSTDGTHWMSRQTSALSGINYFDAYYAKGLFVAGGTDTDRVSHLTTSADGVTWIDHPVTLAKDQIADHIGYGNGTYVAVNTVALTSTDGVTWHEHDIESLANQPFFYAPAYANGVFVCLGSDITANEVLYYSSDDGATWHAAATPLPNTDFMVSLATNGHGFVLTGIDETFPGSQNGVTYTSSDGNTWTRQALAGDLDGFFDPMVWNGSQYVTVSAAIGTAANVYASPDGIAWTKGASATLNAGYSGSQHPLIWTGAGYLITGPGPLQIDASADQAKWSTVLNGASGPSTDLSVLQYLNGRYLAAGPIRSGQRQGIFESSDGLKWTQVFSSGNTGRLLALAYGNGMYLAGGDAGTVYYSSDAKTWTAVSPALPAYIYGLAFGKGVLVAVGQAGYTATSTDGKTWVQHLISTPDTITGVAYTGSRFVAVNGDGALYSSTDGASWSTVSFTPPANTTWYGLNWCGDRLVAVGEVTSGSFPVGYVAVSKDGLSWSGAESSSLGNALFADVIYDGSSYVGALAPFAGALYISSDAKTWTAMKGVPSAWVSALVFQGGRYYTAGDEGDLLVAEAKGPVATAGSVSTTAGKAVSGTLTASAASGTALTYSLASDPAHGKVTLLDAGAGTFKYVPDANYSGADSFTFEVSDGIATSAPATESVTVTAPPSSGGGGAFPLVLGVLLFGLGVSRRRN